MRVGHHLTLHVGVAGAGTVNVSASNGRGSAADTAVTDAKTLRELAAVLESAANMAEELAERAAEEDAEEEDEEDEDDAADLIEDDHTRYCEYCESHHE